MPATLDEVQSAALSLPQPARARLAEVLLESLEEHTLAPEETLIEAERRLEALDCGRGQMVSGEEVARRLRNWPTP